MAAKNDVHTLEGEKKTCFHKIALGGGEDSPLHLPVDETLYVCMYVRVRVLYSLYLKLLSLFGCHKVEWDE